MNKRAVLGLLASITTAAVIMPVSSALACSNKESHSALAQYVEIIVKNNGAEPFDVKFLEDLMPKGTQSVIPGKSVSYNASISADGTIQYTTRIGESSDADFKVVNSGGTKWEKVGIPDNIKCSRDWGKTNKRWKVTYTVQ